MLNGHLVVSGVGEIKCAEVSGFDFLTCNEISVRLTEANKDQLRRIVRDWDFAEEAALRDAEEYAGYPIGQTLKAISS